MTIVHPPLPEHQATPDETSFEQKETAGLSQGQIVRRRFFRHKGALISMIVLILVVILAATSIGWGPIPHWYKWTYQDQPDLLPPKYDGSPTLAVWPFSSHFNWGIHPFGQDETGIDLFANVMRGTQQTLIVILVMGVLSTVIGVVIGALAGYYRGWVDTVLMRFTDLIITLPVILIVAVLGRALKATGIWPVAVSMGLLLWVGLARLVRAEFLTLREREFVDASRVAGASDARIIFKHILPNSVGVIVVNTTLLLGGGILTEAALSFLGFGIQFPDVSLGSLISFFAQSFGTRPWLFVWPGVFIIIIVLCINFIGDGLRDAFDPRQKRIPKAKDLKHVEATGDQLVGNARPAGGALGSTGG